MYTYVWLFDFRFPLYLLSPLPPRRRQVPRWRLRRGRRRSRPALPPGEKNKNKLCSKTSGWKDLIENTWKIVWLDSNREGDLIGEWWIPPQRKFCVGKRVDKTNSNVWDGSHPEEYYKWEEEQPSWTITSNNSPSPTPKATTTPTFPRPHGFAAGNEKRVLIRKMTKKIIFPPPDLHVRLAGDEGVGLSWGHRRHLSDGGCGGGGAPRRSRRRRRRPVGGGFRRRTPRNWNCTISWTRNIHIGKQFLFRHLSTFVEASLASPFSCLKPLLAFEEEGGGEAFPPDEEEEDEDEEDGEEDAAVVIGTTTFILPPQDLSIPVRRAAKKDRNTRRTAAAAWWRLYFFYRNAYFEIPNFRLSIPCILPWLTLPSRRRRAAAPAKTEKKNHK